MRPYNEVEVELRQEIRGLAEEIVRFDTWAIEAAQDGHFERVALCHTQRDLALDRRYRLLRELWGR